MQAAFTQLPAVAFRPICDRAHRATLHRIRGVTQLLSGWAQLPLAEGETRNVDALLSEFQQLLDRADELWNQGQAVQPEALLNGDWPQYMLSTCLRLGTPDEHQQPLPVQGAAALAAAMWIEAVAGKSLELRFRWSPIDDTTWELALDASPAPKLEPTLERALEPWVEEVHSDDEWLSGTVRLKVRLARAAAEVADQTHSSANYSESSDSKH